MALAPDLNENVNLFTVNLLKKYIRHVELMEGYNFIGDFGCTDHEVVFYDEEKEFLVELSKSIDRE